MTIRHNLRPARALRVHCPVSDTAFTAFVDGRQIDPTHAPALARILDVVGQGGPLGDFGRYRSVVEMTPGLELFTPGADATPALGQAATESISPTVILTIYIPNDSDQATVDAAIDAILAAHPWEAPVIELREVSLIARP